MNTTSLIARGLRHVATLLLLCVFLPAAIAADTDGDGVDDAADCAPDDATLATVHRYYFDRDGDQQGALGDPAELCSTVPFPGSVLWHGDTDDADADVRTEMVPRGERVFGLDFFDSDASGTPVLPYVDELGVQALAVKVHWLLLESAPGVFEGPEMAMLDIVRDVALAAGLRINLTVAVPSPYGLVLPPDLAQDFYAGARRLDDATMVERYTALLDAVHARLGDVELTSLQLGYDVDQLIADAPVASLWDDFGRFVDAAASHARGLWGASLRIGLTASAAGLLDPVTGPILEQLNTHTDLVSFTYAPRSEDYEVPAATMLADDLGAVLARYPGRALAMPAVSFPSAPATGSSQTRQSQFLAALFDFWDAHAGQIGYVGLYRLFDRAPAQVDAALASGLYEVAVGDEARAAAWLRSPGLRRYDDGSAKSAYQVLRTELFARGWDAFIAPTSRSYRLAIGSFAHDQLPDAPLDDAVLDEVYADIAARADMVVHHFDRGVPWSEALADDFTSALPPYSAHLLDTWAKLRARQPAGHAVAVAVNPLGVPRDRLAPYWGNGEGFYLGADGEPVGTGVIEDYVERLLPPPFDTLALDAPAVRTAYTNYVKRVIDYFQPDYIVTGLEVNLLAASGDASAVDAYVSLQRHVYEALKADPAYADVPIVASFAAEFFLDDAVGVPMLIDNLNDPALEAAHFAAFDAVEPWVDVIGLSIYPVKTRYGADRLPAFFFEQLYARLGARSDKRFAITETGYPSRTVTVGDLVIRGSPTRQQRYFDLLFSAASRFDRLDFVTNFVARDITPYMDRLRERAAADPPLESAALVDFYQYFEFIGLADPLGNPLPAATLFSQTRDLTYTGGTGAGSEQVEISSPDGRINARFGIDGSGHLYHEVTRDGVVVLEAAPLGLVVDGVDIGSAADGLSNTLPVEVDETFATRGGRSSSRDHYRESIVSVSRGAPGAGVLEIEVRAYDDGVAFRYRVPGSGARLIGGEATSWRLPADSTVWFQTNTTNYESFYFRGRAGEIGDAIGFPLTARTGDGPYVLLSAAGAAGWSGMTLRAELGSRTLAARFPDDTDWTVAGGSTGPWRFAAIAGDLDALVNADLLDRLSPAPDPTLFPDGPASDWIRPGKALWSWWSDEFSGYRYDVQQRYVDEAHAMGLDYVVIDAWWELGFASEGQDAFARLATLVDYAHTDGRDIDLWVWKNWFELLEDTPRRAFFDAVANAGAVGVKIDNVLGQGSNAAASRSVRETLLRDAAERGLMINFHGMPHPAGLSRTWPNQVTEEGFAGLEVNGLVWDEGLFAPASHNTTLPFTRFVLGPGDYTPVTFDARKTGGTTFAHQLATAGVFASPVMHFADDPDFLRQPANVQDLLTAMPTTWDETRVLAPSAIGELVVMARRDGTDWWLFALNGDENNGRQFEADLGFLGTTRYDAVLAADDTATSFTRSELSGVGAGDAPLAVDLLPGGGFVARFSAVPATRSFRMGSTALPPNTNEGWGELFTRLATDTDVIVQSFQEGVPWNEALLSDNLADYPASVRQLVEWQHYLLTTYTPGHDVYLMVNPIDVRYDRKAPYWGETSNMPLPPPWDSYAFDHPDVEQAFINYLTALIETFQPRFVAINVEANIFLAKRPLEWQQFKTFNANVYDAMKARYPDISFFSTIQYEHMLGLHVESRALGEQLADTYPDVLLEESRALLAHSDAVAISTYPYMIVDNVGLSGDDNVVVASYFDSALDLRNGSGLPLMFEQTGYISEPLTTASGDTVDTDEQTQQNFLRYVLEFATAEQAALVSNFVAIDYGDFYGTGAIEQTWASAGLYRQDLSEKPALTTWRAFFDRPYTPDSAPTAIEP